MWVWGQIVLFSGRYLRTLFRSKHYKQMIVKLFRSLKQSKLMNRFYLQMQKPRSCVMNECQESHLDFSYANKETLVLNASLLFDLCFFFYLWVFFKYIIHKAFCKILYVASRLLNAVLLYSLLYQVHEVLIDICIVWTGQMLFLFYLTFCSSILPLYLFSYFVLYIF